MLTRLKLKRGEGALEEFNPNIERVHHRNKMKYEEYREEDEKGFCKDFY